MNTQPKKVSSRRAQQALESFYARELEDYKKKASTIYTFQELCTTFEKLLKELFTSRDLLISQGVSRSMLVNRIEMSGPLESLIKMRTNPFKKNTAEQESISTDSTDGDEEQLEHKSIEDVGEEDTSPSDNFTDMDYQ